MDSIIDSINNAENFNDLVNAMKETVAETEDEFATFSAAMNEKIAELQLQTKEADYLKLYYIDSNINKNNKNSLINNYIALANLKKTDISKDLLDHIEKKLRQRLLSYYENKINKNIAPQYMLDVQSLDMQELAENIISQNISDIQILAAQMLAAQQASQVVLAAQIVDEQVFADTLSIGQVESAQMLAEQIFTAEKSEADQLRESILANKTPAEQALTEQILSKYALAAIKLDGKLTELKEISAQKLAQQLFFKLVQIYSESGERIAAAEDSTTSWITQIDTELSQYIVNIFNNNQDEMQGNILAEILLDFNVYKPALAELIINNFVKDQLPLFHHQNIKSSDFVINLLNDYIELARLKPLQAVLPNLSSLIEIKLEQNIQNNYMCSALMSKEIAKIYVAWGESVYHSKSVTKVLIDNNMDFNTNKELYDILEKLMDNSSFSTSSKIKILHSIAHEWALFSLVQFEKLISNIGKYAKNLQELFAAFTISSDPSVIITLDFREYFLKLCNNITLAQLESNKAKVEFIYDCSQFLQYREFADTLEKVKKLIASNNYQFLSSMDRNTSSSVLKELMYSGILGAGTIDERDIAMLFLPERKTDFSGADVINRCLEIFNIFFKNNASNTVWNTKKNKRKENFQDPHYFILSADELYRTAVMTLSKLIAYEEYKYLESLTGEQKLEILPALLKYKLFDASVYLRSKVVVEPLEPYENRKRDVISKFWQVTTDPAPSLLQFKQHNYKILTDFLLIKEYKIFIENVICLLKEQSLLLNIDDIYNNQALFLTTYSAIHIIFDDLNKFYGTSETLLQFIQDLEEVKLLCLDKWEQYNKNSQIKMQQISDALLHQYRNVGVGSVSTILQYLESRNEGYFIGYRIIDLMQFRSNGRLNDETSTYLRFYLNIKSHFNIDETPILTLASYLIDSLKIKGDHSLSSYSDELYNTLSIIIDTKLLSLTADLEKLLTDLSLAVDNQLSSLKETILKEITETESSSIAVKQKKLLVNAINEYAKKMLVEAENFLTPQNRTDLQQRYPRLNELLTYTERYFPADFYFEIVYMLEKNNIFTTPLLLQELLPTTNILQLINSAQCLDQLNKIWFLIPVATENILLAAWQEQAKTLLQQASQQMSDTNNVNEPIKALIWNNHRIDINISSGRIYYIIEHFYQLVMNISNNSNIKTTLQEILSFNNYKLLQWFTHTRGAQAERNDKTNTNFLYWKGISEEDIDQLSNEEFLATLKQKKNETFLSIYEKFKKQGIFTTQDEEYFHQHIQTIQSTPNQKTSNLLIQLENDPTVIQNSNALLSNHESPENSVVIRLNKDDPLNPYTVLSGDKNDSEFSKLIGNIHVQLVGHGNHIEVTMGGFTPDELSRQLNALLNKFPESTAPLASTQSPSPKNNLMIDLVSCESVNYDNVKQGFAFQFFNFLHWANTSKENVFKEIFNLKLVAYSSAISVDNTIQNSGNIIPLYDDKPSVKVNYYMYEEVPSYNIEIHTFERVEYPHFSLSDKIAIARKNGAPLYYDMPLTTWDKRILAPSSAKSSRNSHYDSQVIVQLEDTSIVRNAVEALAAKHGSELPTVIVQLDTAGTYTIISGNDTQAERAKLTGRVRWQMVGHGRDSSSHVADEGFDSDSSSSSASDKGMAPKKMSGRTAEQLATAIAQLQANLSLPSAAHEKPIPSTSRATISSTPLNEPKIAHISLVGCQLIDEAGKTGFAVDFINKLPRELTNDGKLTVSAHAVDIAVSDTVDDIGRKFELVTQVENLPDNSGSELKKQKFILTLDQDNELHSTASSDIAKRTPYQQTLSKLGEINNIITEMRAGERSVYDLNVEEQRVLTEAFPADVHSADRFDKNRVVSLAFNAEQYETFSQQIAVIETYGAESDWVKNESLNKILSITEVYVNQQQHIMEEIVRFDIENSSAASPNRSITLLPSPTLALFGNGSPAERQRTLGLGLSWLQNRLSSGESTHFISAVRHHTLFSDARAQGAMLVTQDVEYYHQFTEQLNNMGALAKTHATTWFKPITLMNGSWALADGAYQFNIDGRQVFLHIDAAHHKYALYQAGAAVIESTGTADDGGQTATDFYRTVDTLLQRQSAEPLKLYQLQTDKLGEIAETPTAKALNSAMTNLATKTEWQKIATQGFGDNPTGKFLIQKVQIEALRLVQLGATFAGRPLTLADFNTPDVLTRNLRFDGEKVANFIYSADVQDPEVQNIRKLLQGIVDANNPISAKRAQFTGPQGEHIFKSLKASIKDSSLLRTQVPAHFNTPHFTLSQRALNDASSKMTKVGYCLGARSILMGISQLQQLQQQDTSQMSPTQLAQHQQTIADAKWQLSMGFGQMAFNGVIDAAQFAITKTWGINLLNKLGPRALGRAAVAIPGLNLLSLAFDGYQIIDTHKQLQTLQEQLANTTDPSERNRLEWEIGRTKVNQNLNYVSLAFGIGSSGVLLVGGLASAGIISSTGMLASFAASGPVGWVLLGGAVVLMVATQAFTAASRVAELNQQIWLNKAEKWENFFSYIAYGEPTDREINRLSWDTFVTKGRPQQEKEIFEHARAGYNKNKNEKIGYITSTAHEYEELPIYKASAFGRLNNNRLIRTSDYKLTYGRSLIPPRKAFARSADKNSLLAMGFSNHEIRKSNLLYYRCIETKESTNDSIDLNNSQTFTKSFNGTTADNSKHTYGIFTPTEHKSVLVEFGDGNDSFTGLKNHPEIIEIVHSGSGIKDFKGGDGATLFNMTQLTAGSVYDGGGGFNILTFMPPTTPTYDIILQAESDKPTTSGSQITFKNINRIIVENNPKKRVRPIIKIEDRAHKQNYIDVGDNLADINAGGGNDITIFCRALVSGGEGEDIYAIYKNRLPGWANIAMIDIEDDDYPHQRSYIFLEYDVFDIKKIKSWRTDAQSWIIFLLKDDKGAETSLRIKSKNFILQTRDGVQITYRPEQLELSQQQTISNPTVLITPKLWLGITTSLAADKPFLPAVFHQNPNPVSHKVVLNQESKRNSLTRRLPPSSPAETWQMPTLDGVALNWVDENAWLKNERYSDNLMQSNDEIEAPTLADTQTFTLVSNSGNDVLQGNGGKLNYIVNVHPGELNRTITINNRNTIGTLIFGSAIAKLSHILIEGNDVILQTQDKPAENTRIRLIDFVNNPAMQDLIIIAKKTGHDQLPTSRYIIKFDYEASIKKPRLVELDVKEVLSSRDKTEKRLQAAGDVTRQLNNNTMLINDTTLLPADKKVLISGDKKTVYDSSTTSINYILTAAAATLTIAVPDTKKGEKTEKRVTIEGSGVYSLSSNAYSTAYTINTKEKSNITVNSFSQGDSFEFTGFNTQEEVNAFLGGINKNMISFIWGHNDGGNSSLSSGYSQHSYGSAIITIKNMDHISFKMTLADGSAKSYYYNVSQDNQITPHYIYEHSLSLQPPYRKSVSGKNIYLIDVFSQLTLDIKYEPHIVLTKGLQFDDFKFKKRGNDLVIKLLIGKDPGEKHVIKNYFRLSEIKKSVYLYQPKSLINNQELISIDLRAHIHARLTKRFRSEFLLPSTSGFQQEHFTHHKLEEFSTIKAAEHENLFIKPEELRAFLRYCYNQTTTSLRSLANNGALNRALSELLLDDSKVIEAYKYDNAANRKKAMQQAIKSPKLRDNLPENIKEIGIEKILKLISYGESLFLNIPESLDEIGLNIWIEREITPLIAFEDIGENVRLSQLDRPQLFCGYIEEKEEVFITIINEGEFAQNLVKENIVSFRNEEQFAQASESATILKSSVLPPFATQEIGS